MVSFGHEEIRGNIIQGRSGVLLHVTSLPGPEGIGTLGQGAYNWIDFLEKAGMKDPEKREETGGKLAAAISNVVLLMFLMVIVSFLI